MVQILQSFIDLGSVGSRNSSIESIGHDIVWPSSSGARVGLSLLFFISIMILVLTLGEYHIINLEMSILIDHWGHEVLLFNRSLPFLFWGWGIELTFLHGRISIKPDKRLFWRGRVELGHSRSEDQQENLFGQNNRRFRRVKWELECLNTYGCFQHDGKLQTLLNSGDSLRVYILSWPSDKLLRITPVVTFHASQYDLGKIQSVQDKTWICEVFEQGLSPYFLLK